MSIRSNASLKDHLKEKSELQLVNLVRPKSQNDPLRFWTSHPTKACFVDLSEFEKGRGARRKSGFTGRPSLIFEMAPVIRDQLAPLAEKSVQQSIVALRAWWRLFDEVEQSAPTLMPVTSVAYITDVHRQRAFDIGMRRLVFTNFLTLANTTRVAFKLHRLHWQSPEDPEPIRHLPPMWQMDLIRRGLKHEWFAVLDRWALADILVSRGEPTADARRQPVEYASQLRLLRNYERYAAASDEHGLARPTGEMLWGAESSTTFSRRGLNVAEMVRGNFPDGNDIRCAFHLCLATTGWNPAVLLSLDVRTSFLEPHPKDPARYILRGTKARATGAEQVVEGLFKTQGSAGVIISTLIARTSRLRDQVNQDLVAARAKLTRLEASHADSRELHEQIALVSSLQRGVRSPWLFAATNKPGVLWLDDGDFARNTERDNRTWLEEFIGRLNARQPDNKRIAVIKPSDLRDAHAARVYDLSGGSIFAVMKALGHKSPASTHIYLTNTLLREEHRKLFGTFSNALWSEIREHGRVDPTVIAKWSRDGLVTDAERARLTEYRGLLRSRIGVACRDPLNPPKHIAPEFKADGVQMCHVQRCTLCIENAVLLPESVSGLCKRLAELRHIRTEMSIVAFQQSSFAEELENTEIALLAFDQGTVAETIADWSQKIAIGTHRVMSFDGITAGGDL